MSGSASTTGGTAGTGGTTGGTGGSTGGTGGSTGGTAGTGGTIVQMPLCETQTPKALPIPLDGTWSFPDSDGQSFSEFAFDGDCAERAPGTAVGGCKNLTWTPNMMTDVGWFWHNTQGNWSGAGVCVADGAKYVRLQAKASIDGVVGKVGATGTEEIDFTLTTEWQTIEIPLTGVAYNTANAPDGGVNTGLFLYLHREGGDTAERTISIDNIVWTADEGGGEGGAGGGGGEGGAMAGAGGG
jgi:hypothetical protein